jgi:tRNA U34 5-methylaminomethyl-2-thiouridine-forming methyltransferase MnmC
MPTSSHRELTFTKDGSPTFFVPLLDEHYHSIPGALQESEHVFVKMGWDAVEKPMGRPLDVLEMGMGTGLNAALFAELSEQRQAPIRYTSIEKYPLKVEEYRAYCSRIDFGHLLEIHEREWTIPAVIHPYFTLTKLEVDLLHYSTESKFDLILFDAFAPDAQPELWSSDVFSRLYNVCNKGAALVTYSAKGAVKRNMIQAGFDVEKVPGPPGKREMLRAWKK